LRQVIKNLLSNAFKFTEEGSVRVAFEVSAAGGVTVAVSDTGIGVAPETQQLIFEAFAQADGTTARQYGGTGLGLSISREIVALLGGRIALASTPGQGSTFTVHLPRQAEPNGVAAPETAVLVPGGDPLADRDVSAPADLSDLADLAGLKVLVVDDDPRNVFALTALLHRGNLEVVPAAGGEEAVALLRDSSDIDLALVDIMMPVMDGYATMRAMRELPAGVDIPIIAVTAKVGAGERQRCLDAGASDYVPKPVENGPDFLRVLADSLVAVVAAR
jgi:two-component system chemotaxis sensor kinase CheA